MSTNEKYEVLGSEKWWDKATDDDDDDDDDDDVINNLQHRSHQSINRYPWR